MDLKEAIFKVQYRCKMLRDECLEERKQIGVHRGYVAN